MTPRGHTLLALSSYANPYINPWTDGTSSSFGRRSHRRQPDLRHFARRIHLFRASPMAGEQRSRQLLLQMLDKVDPSTSHSARIVAVVLNVGGATGCEPDRRDSLGLRWETY